MQGCAYWYVKRLSYTQQPFQQIKPDAKLKILFLGDSTAVGTGSEDPKTSVAGWFAKDFPDAHIVNHSKNGRKLLGVLDELQKEPPVHYDLIVIQAGANDIIRFTPSAQVKKRLYAVLEKAKSMADHVVFFHCGDIGAAPIFLIPADWILTARMKAMRKIYLQAEAKTGAYYVDLLASDADEIFLKDKQRYYAKDMFHLSGDGYRIWYDEIRKELRSRGVHAFQ